jgi:hypothetical protein
MPDGRNPASACAARALGIELMMGLGQLGFAVSEPLSQLVGAGIVHLSNDTGVGQLVTQLRDRLPWLGSRCACSSPSDSRRTIAASVAAGTARASATWRWASSQACCALAGEGDVSGSIGYTEWHYGALRHRPSRYIVYLPRRGTGAA